MKYFFGVIFIGTLLLLQQSTSFAQSWFEQKNRGWYWFEEERKQNKQEQKKPAETPEEAQEELLQYQREERGLHRLMVRNPTEENIVRYRKKLLEIEPVLDRLARMWDLVNFKYPELSDRSKRPGNVEALKVKQEVQKTIQRQELEQLAQDYGLVFLRKSDCQFCERFEPILERFASFYGFKVDAVSLDGSKSSFFPTKHAPELVTALKIEATPMVFLVSNKGAGVVEYCRGLLSFDELETTALVAVQYFKSTQK